MGKRKKLEHPYGNISFNFDGDFTMDFSRYDNCSPQKEEKDQKRRRERPRMAQRKTQGAKNSERFSPWRDDEG